MQEMWGQSGGHPLDAGKSPLSLPLSVVLATWARIVAWKVVSQLFGFHWNTIRKAVKDVVDYGFENRNLDNFLYIGIDEISRKKGHVYHTQVYDLDRERASVVRGRSIFGNPGNFL
jgi:hypothetical protein